MDPWETEQWLARNQNNLRAPRVFVGTIHTPRDHLSPFVWGFVGGVLVAIIVWLVFKVWS